MSRRHSPHGTLLTLNSPQIDLEFQQEVFCSGFFVFFFLSFPSPFLKRLSHLETQTKSKVERRKEAVEKHLQVWVLDVN